jgi:hypothetical protein
MFKPSFKPTTTNLHVANNGTVYRRSHLGIAQSIEYRKRNGQTGVAYSSANPLEAEKVWGKICNE